MNSSRKCSFVPAFFLLHRQRSLHSLVSDAIVVEYSCLIRDPNKACPGLEFTGVPCGLTTCGGMSHDVGVSPDDRVAQLHRDRCGAEYLARNNQLAPHRLSRHLLSRRRNRHHKHQGKERVANEWGHVGAAMCADSAEADCITTTLPPSEHPPPCQPDNAPDRDGCE